MSGIDLFAWIILCVILLAIIALAIVLGSLPGRIATNRNHPQRDAIRVAGWAGLLLGGVPWFLALVWAFTRSALPPEPTHEPKPVQELPQ